MKCSHCGEELGLNDICINPKCSHFGTAIDSSQRANLNNTENNTQSADINTTENNSNFNNNYSGSANDNYTNNDNSYNKAAYDSTIRNSNNYNDDISIEEFSTFIGYHNTNHYLKYINKRKNNKKFASWNWPCFFLTYYWLLYRKLYVPAVIFICLNFALSHVLIGARLNILLTPILRIALSIFANALYLNHCEKKIKSIKEIRMNLSSLQYMNRLQAKGGVNLALPIIVFVILCIAGIVLSSFLLFSTLHSPHEFSSPSYYF